MRYDEAIEKTERLREATSLLNRELTIYFALARRAGLPEDMHRGVVLALQGTRAISNLSSGLGAIGSATSLAGAIPGVGQVALAAFMGYGILTDLQQWGKENLAEIQRRIGMEQQAQLAALQIELRRKRW